ncbi:hypothetical protein [Streptomyces sp. LN549]
MCRVLQAGRPVMRGVDAAVSFAERPLCAALHEPVRAQGGRATG